ncbi:MAG: S26 family signal peptidase [Bacteroidota bacterium]|jgi:signal peptidase I
MDSTLLFYIIVLLSFAGLYKVFEKMGEKGWKALVPVYNFYTWIILLKKPKWWVVFFIIPGVNVLMFAILLFQTAYGFKKRSVGDLALASLLCFFYVHYLGFFSKDLKWNGPDDFNNLKGGAIKNWLDPIFFAIVAASIIRTFFLEAFTIPTSSLEKSLLVGDFLFVNKLSYGSRVPMTPLSFPLAHHTIPVANTKAYLEFWKLPYTRLPGYKKIKNNDIVVFNYPDGDTTLANMQDRSYYNVVRQEAFTRWKFSGDTKKTMDDFMPEAWTHLNAPENTLSGTMGDMPFGKKLARPIDKREHYVKRCVAIAGDLLEIKDGQLYINNKPAENPEHLQHFYNVICNPDIINEEWLDKNNVNVDEAYSFSPRMFDLDSNLVGDFYSIANSNYGEGNAVVKGVKKYSKQIIEGKLSLFRLNFEDSRIPELLKNEGVVFAVMDKSDRGEYDFNIFPHDTRFKWNNDNFGPLQIPKTGMTIKIDTSNISLFERIIDVYDNNELRIEKGKVYINGKIATEYTFKQDYYWMMGDNRHNSADSRSWGFVPFDHVVGTPVFVWFSLKYDDKQPISGKWSFKNIFASEKDGKLRWSRFFCFVSDKGLSSSYFIHFLIIAGIWYGITKYRKIKKAKESKDNNPEKL